MSESKEILRRYTDLASLLDLLHHSAITLLPPSSWDDRNDRLLMATYRKAKNLETLLALCMSEKGETYHHWRVFTDKGNGVCICFHRHSLAQAMAAANVQLRGMDYLKFGDLKPRELPEDRLPFLKRAAFRDEGEIRAVYESRQKEDALKKVQISFDMIERIILNPWMPKEVGESVTSAIKKLTPHGANLRVTHSALIESSVWREFARNYADVQQF